MAKTLREQKINQIIYISLGGAIAVIILFIILFNVFSNKNKSNDLEIAQNGNKQNTSEQANSSIGKTVDESKKTEEKDDNESINIQLSKQNNDQKSSEELKEENNSQSNLSNNGNSGDNSANSEKVSTETSNNIQNSEDIKNSTNEINSAKEDIETNGKVEEEQNPTFIIPVEGEIFKHFGKDKLVYSDTLKEWTTHLGVDIKADKTTIVKASCDGSVKSIKNDPRYGLTVVVEHKNGFVSVYSNLLTAEFVVVGENVKAGQTLGTVGNTATFEILDDPHLHFEILKDGNAVDPEMYMR